MNINWKTATKICVALLVWDAAVQLTNIRIINRLKRHKKALLEINHLLAQTMDRNGIGLDPFDEIAIHETIITNK